MPLLNLTYIYILQFNQIYVRTSALSKIVAYCAFILSCYTCIWFPHMSLQFQQHHIPHIMRLGCHVSFDNFQFREHWSEPREWHGYWKCNGICTVFAFVGCWFTVSVSSVIIHLIRVRTWLFDGFLDTTESYVFEFSVDIGVLVIGLSQISFFFSLSIKKKLFTMCVLLITQLIRWVGKLECCKPV